MRVVSNILSLQYSVPSIQYAVPVSIVTYLSLTYTLSQIKKITSVALFHGLACMPLCSTLACAEDLSTVLCRVDDSEITVGHVKRQLLPALQGRKPSAGALQRLQAKTLSLLIDRRLVLRYLHRTKQGGSEQDIDHRIEQFARHLARRRQTISQHLDETNQSSEDLRRRVAWEIGWQRYLDKHMTDQTLQKYFESHRRHFDGTRLQVAHILLQPENKDSDHSITATAARATEIANRIATQELTFAEAAQEYSDAPSAKVGGDIGTISRRAPMPESFSRAAFALERGEISPPVHTKFGVHLIQCAEVQPGDRTWQDVRPELIRALRRELFQQAADRERRLAPVEFTSAGRQIQDSRVLTLP